MLLRGILGNNIYQPFRILKREIIIAKRVLSTEIDFLSFKNEKLLKYLESLRREFYNSRIGGSANTSNKTRVNVLSGIARSIEQRTTLIGNINSLQDLNNEKDEDMIKLLQEENEVYKNLLKETEDQLLHQLLKICDSDYYPAVIFEINAGAGGQEAMLFAKDLYNMYVQFIENNRWDYDVIDEEKTDIGGLRNATLVIKNENAFNNLCYEAGVHRVQRIPVTEKSGRIHTSTVSVAVIPQSADVDCNINEKDLKIETKRATGAGGQHVNTTDSAVRIVHIPSGFAVECQTERSQIKNRQIALKRLQAKILQNQITETEANKNAIRKLQQGNLNRNEKIRTYNFPQDRVTDHRIKSGTAHNLMKLLEGGSDLSLFLNRILAEHRKNKLQEILANFSEDDKQDSIKENQKM